MWKMWPPNQPNFWRFGTFARTRGVELSSYRAMVGFLSCNLRKNIMDEFWILRTNKCRFLQGQDCMKNPSVYTILQILLLMSEILHHLIGVSPWFTVFPMNPRWYWIGPSTQQTKERFDTQDLVAKFLTIEESWVPKDVLGSGFHKNVSRTAADRPGHNHSVCSIFPDSLLLAAPLLMAEGGGHPPFCWQSYG